MRGGGWEGGKDSSTQPVSLIQAFSPELECFCPPQRSSTDPPWMVIKHLGWGRDRADPPFNVSRLDWGGAGLYTFFLPIQSIPGAGEGLDRQPGQCGCTEPQE